MTNPRHACCVLAVMLLCFGSVCKAADLAPASPQTRETRSHHVLQDDKGSVHYELSSITRVGSDFFQKSLLVRDVDHGDVIMEHRTVYGDGVATTTVSDVKRKSFIRASFPLPSAAKTVADARKEDDLNPELANASVILTLTTNGGEWSAIESEWQVWSALRTLRRSIRATMPTFLMEAFERMRGTVFETSNGRYYYSALARFVLYDSADDDSRSTLIERAAMPDCEFDETFGFPCSDAQVKLIKAATEEKKLLHRY
jgi:hypothetical protein